MIHPTALIADGAIVDRSATIGPYCTIDAQVVVQANCVLESHVCLQGNTRLEESVRVAPFAVIGGEPQSVGFDSSIQSGVIIGEGTTLREGVTVNRATQPGGMTRVGPNCFLMAGAHVGHDAEVSHSVIMANNALLGGHVQVGPHCFLGGGSAFHQFTRVGTCAMIAGGAEVSYDVPPFTMVSGRNILNGLNLVGIKRQKIARESIAELKKLYRLMFTSTGSFSKRLGAIDEGDWIPASVEGKLFLDFFRHQGRGFVR